MIDDVIELLGRLLRGLFFVDWPIVFGLYFFTYVWCFDFLSFCNLFRIIVFILSVDQSQTSGYRTY